MRHTWGAYAIACAAGTGAALGGLVNGSGPGDQVVVPEVAFVATANASRAVGAEVVFAIIKFSGCRCIPA